MSDIEINDPERVTFGTVGPVGQRVFILQARKGREVATLKMEKVQVATLSTFIGRLLRGLAQPGDLPGPSLLELESFEQPDFVVRVVRVGFDEAADRVIVICGEADDDPEEPDDDDDTDDDGERSSARFAITREQAFALAIRGNELVDAGRPPCPRCQHPLDPRGHVCPKMNGNRPPIT